MNILRNQNCDIFKF